MKQFLFALILLVGLLQLSIAQIDPTVSHTQTFDREAPYYQYLDQSTVFVISNRKLYRSVDKGIDWKEVNLPEQNAGNSPISLILSGHEKKYIFVTSTGLLNWVSSDKGATFQKAGAVPETLEDVHFNPHDPSHLFAVGHTFPEFLLGTVYTSKDFGKTWANSIDYVIIGSPSWGDAGTHQVPATRLYFSFFDGVSDFVLASSDDFGKNWEAIHERVIATLWRHNHLFVLQYSVDFSEVYLKTSKDVGKGKKAFYRCEFSQYGDEENLHSANDHLYYLLDDHTGAVHFGILREGHHEYMEIWSSGVDGIQYTPTLYDVRYDHLYAAPEFISVHGLSGVLWANQFTGWEEGEVHSVISFDNGKTWDWLIAPGETHTDNRGLHLHSYATWHFYGPVYSHWTARGIIIGNGNVGEYLESEVHGTYLSIDGGYTWKSLATFRTIYEVADYGSIIVWAETENEAKEIHYTLDYGRTLKSVKLPRAFKVGNIVTSSSPDGTNFLVLSEDQKSSFSLEFKPSLNNRVCVVPSDYTTWVPVNPHTKGVGNLKCLAGKQESIRRKKNLCAHPHDFNAHQIADTKYCPCEEEDYECDFGYVWNDRYECERDTRIDKPDPPHWCLPGDQYNVTDGYRPEPGNMCQGDIHRHTTKQCPSTPVETESSYTRHSSTHPSTSTSRTSTHTSRTSTSTSTSRTSTHTSKTSTHTSTHNQETSRTTKSTVSPVPSSATKDDKNNTGGSHTGVVVTVVLLVIVGLIAAAVFVLWKFESVRDRIPFIQTLINMKNGYSSNINMNGGALMDDEDLGERL